MQTFVPYNNFQHNALALDARRLGKQRLEGRQILETLLLGNSAWQNHPAVLMWKGYEVWLAGYTAAMCGVWLALGYDDYQLGRISILMSSHFDSDTEPEPPPWWGDRRVHFSHRAALYRKDPEHYALFEPFAEHDWTCCEGCNYFWPTHDKEYRNERV
jgi:hypothetical protein